MLKRLRRLNISLAAKCQILFGAAVVLIISAALFVPWLRMEQLADQIDRRAAATLARDVVLRHVDTELEHPIDINLPGKTPLLPTTQQTRPRNDEPFLSPRMVGVVPPEEMEHLTQFQRNALLYFREHPREDSVGRYYSRGDELGFRYAQALYAQGRCLDCHSARPASVDAPSATPMPTGPMVRPGELLGVVLVDIPSQVQSSQLLLNRVFILTAGLFAGVLAIIVFWLITFRLILRPVRVLQETAQKVSEGDLNIRSDISTGDEFQQLSETFNEMLANLKRSEDQLRAANKSLDLKLGQLSETNLGLFESNRLKSEFLANVSHELRTPLNSILGFADLLKDAAAPETRSQRYIQNILRSGQHLLDLINDLLDLAKIEAGRMEVRTEAVSMPDVFEGLASLLKPLYEAKHLTLDTTLAPGLPVIYTDPAKLQQILYNFLSNAIKFSPIAGTIHVIAGRESDHMLRISVTDHGPGIEPAQHEVIFEKFRQIDASVTREHGGSGLGLAISKELATLLGAGIGVQSIPGQGATFWLVLPIKAPARS